jgi:hypothetical protein
MKLRTTLLAAALIVAAASFWPTLTADNALAQSTRVALHATREEIEIWKQRRNSGPYLDDWNRIINRANNFRSNPDSVWSGQTTNDCWQGDPTPGRERANSVRDAGFVYMLTGDTSYSTLVRTHLLNQAAQAGTDFSNSTRWCANSTMNNVIDLGPWLRNLVYAYDYIKPSLPAGDIATLNAWFLGAGNYLNTKLDLRVKLCFPNYQSDNWSVSCGIGNTKETHWQGWMAQNQMGVFQNQEAVGMSAMTAIAVVLNNSTLKTQAVRFVKGWLRVSVFPDGTVSDQYRWILFDPNNGNGDPGLGYAYVSAAIGSMVSAADHLQRAGENIYQFSTSDGIGNSVGGSKSIGLVVKRLAQIQQHAVNVYGSISSTLTDCKRIDDFLLTSQCSGYSNNHRIVQDMAPMAQSNIFYKDSTVQASYSRTPHSDPTNGGYDPFGGDWGNYPGARFMFGQMEGKVSPYPSGTTVVSPPSPGPSNLVIQVIQ